MHRRDICLDMMLVSMLFSYELVVFSDIDTRMETREYVTLATISQQ